MMNAMPEPRPTFEQTKIGSEQTLSTNNTGRWTGEEHNRFLQGLQQHGKVWKSIATVVKTRSIVQVRTHAQKYFMKMNRSESPTPSIKSPSAPGNRLPLTDDNNASKPMNLSKSIDRLKNSQWKALGSSAPNSVPKSKSFGSLTTIPSSDPGFVKSPFPFSREGLLVPTMEKPSVVPSKPRARKFDEISGDHQLKSTSTKPVEKVTKKKPPKVAKPSKKKALKLQGLNCSDPIGNFQPLIYYDPSTAPGMPYSNSYPSLADCASVRKQYVSKKNSPKRARLPKSPSKPRKTPSSHPINFLMEGNYSITASGTPGMGESPTHISQPLSCPNFSYYSQESYSFAINEHMEPARIPTCEAEADDSLYLENLLLKESLLSSVKKEWPMEGDEFNLIKQEVPKMGLLDCGELKLKVPGNEAFSLPQKESPTSIAETTHWAALSSYPEFVKEEKYLNMVPEYEDDQFNYDENQLFWFGEDNIGDNIDDLFEKNDQRVN